MRCMSDTKEISEEDLYGATVLDNRKMVPVDFFVQYLDAVKRNWDEIAAAKLAVIEGDDDAFRVACADIPNDDEQLLWRAPTKGSIWTVHERRFAKYGLPEQVEQRRIDRAARKAALMNPEPE